VNLPLAQVLCLLCIVNGEMWGRERKEKEIKL
jgi:hypothetical protein